MKSTRRHSSLRNMRNLILNSQVLPSEFACITGGGRFIRRGDAQIARAVGRTGRRSVQSGARDTRQSSCSRVKPLLLAESSRRMRGTTMAFIARFLNVFLLLPATTNAGITKMARISKSSAVCVCRSSRSFASLQINATSKAH